MLAPKRKRDEEDSESEQHGDGAGPGVGADADAPSWPELVSRVLRRVAENTKEPAASKDAVAAIKALDPRMKFLERLSTEEGMLPIRAENGNGSGNAIVDVYSLLSRTFVLPSVRSATGAPMEQSKQSSSSALETRGENKAATFGAGGNMYNEQEECEKRESFAKELPKAIKDEIAHIKDWDAFDVFNVRLGQSPTQRMARAREEPCILCCTTSVLFHPSPHRHMHQPHECSRRAVPDSDETVRNHLTTVACRATWNAHVAHCIRNEIT